MSNIIKRSNPAERVALFVAATPPRALISMLVVLSSLLLLYYTPLLFRGFQYYLQDHTYYFEPLTRYLRERFKEGGTPLWNPFTFCGMSQLACINPTFFYPPNFAYLVLEYSKATAVILMLHQLIAAVGCFLLAILFGWGVSAAITFGVIAGFCGYMFSLSANYTLVTSAAWIPLTVWFFWKLRLSIEVGASIRYVYFTCATIATFMLVSAGRPEIFAPACGLILSMILGLYIRKRKENVHALKALLWELAAFSCGVALTAPLLLPVFEWLRLSPRKSGMELQYSLLWSSNWYDFFMFVFSRPLQDMQVLGNPYLTIAPSRLNCLPLIPNHFVGPVAITLALCGFTDKSWTWRKWLIIATIMVAFACMGDCSPVMPVLERLIPPLTVFRYPSKWMIFLVFCVATAAARGTHLVVRSKSTAWTVALPAVLWTGTLIFSAYVLFSATTIAPDSKHLALWHSLNALCSQDAALASLVGLITTGIVFAKYRGWLNSIAASFLLLVGLTFTLFQSALLTGPSLTYPSYYRKEPYIGTALKAIGASANARFMPLGKDPTSCPASYQQARQMPWTQTYFNYQRDSGLAICAADAKVRGCSGYEATVTGNYDKLINSCREASRANHPTETMEMGSAWDSSLNRLNKMPTTEEIATANRENENESSEKSDNDTGDDLPIYRFLQGTNTTYTTTQIIKVDSFVPILDKRFFKLKLEDLKMNLRIYETLNPLPRAYLSQYWQWKDSQPNAMKAMTEPDKSGFNPALVTWVYSNASTGDSDEKGTMRMFGPIIPPPPKDAPALPSEVQKAFDSKDVEARDPLIDKAPVTVMVDKPEHVALSYNSDRPAMLVLTDHFYPGWQALIDNAKRPTFKTNMDMRAVWVPAGQHLVEFNFEPKSLLYGLYVAAIPILLIFAALTAFILPYFWTGVKKLAGQA